MQTRGFWVGPGALLLAWALVAISCDVTGLGTTASASPTPTATASAGTGATASPTPESSASPTATDEGDVVLDDADIQEITLNGTSIACSASGATVSGSSITITAAGTWRATGSLTDGQIVVDVAEGAGTVQLVLAGVDMACTDNAPVNIASADAVELILAAGTTNRLTQGSSWTAAYGDDESNAALFSMADLTISGDSDGTGSLVLVTGYEDGICSKDRLLIESGNLTVTARDDGIRGKDALEVETGTLVVNSGGDGLVSDGSSTASTASDGLSGNDGSITIHSGSFTVVSGGDALSAAMDLNILGGEFNLASGGGSSATLASDSSAKGIKAGSFVGISGGSFVVSSADDCIHSGADLDISGGVFRLAANPASGQGIKFGPGSTNGTGLISGDSTDISISSSYEGVGGYNLTINGGTLRLNAANDGFSISASTTTGGTENDDGACLTINGGWIVVQVTNGDGVDSNGDVTMTGGTLLVCDAAGSPEEPIDCNGTFEMDGGVLVAVGNYESQMSKALGTSSTQYNILAIPAASQASGTLVHLQDASGTDVLTFKPTVAWECAYVSTPALGSGTYSLYAGGSHSGSATDGLYSSSLDGSYVSNGSYAAGTLVKTFAISSVVTTVNAGSGSTGGNTPPGRSQARTF